MSIPVVAIVGRPNVGKSSLLNALYASRVSIVDPMPGVTRDRISVFMQHGGRIFELIDTGGIGTVDVAELADHVQEQIDFAIEGADLILFMVDVRDGLTPTDKTIANQLRKIGKPLLVVANKADSQKLEADAAEFYQLGLGDVLAISAKQKINTGDLKDKIVSLLPPGEETLDEPVMKLAIVGKRNAGKSTLVNALAQAARQIVSDIPGTTRDSVDVRFEYKGRPFIAIDTAGIRRERAVQHSIEFYSQARAERAMRRADVCLFLIDAAEPLSQVDKKIGSYIVEQCKPAIIVVNKWDLVGKDSENEDGDGESNDVKKYTDYFNKTLLGLDFAPIVFISAKDEDNIEGLIETALDLYRQAGTRASTAEVNRALGQIVKRRRPKIHKVSQQAKFYYATQTGVYPPTFVIFVNNPDWVDSGYIHYMENQLRKQFEFSEVPLKIILRQRENKAAKESAS